jgi:hypothetical protein
MRLDLDRAVFSGEVMAEVGPRPVLRSCHQASADWIAMHVLEFFDGLIVVPHVEALVTTLPEPSISRHLEFSRHLLFQNLQDGGGWEIASFADQQRNMLGHDNISGDNESVALPHLV